MLILPRAQSATMGYSPNAYLLLDQRQRRWANTESALSRVCLAVPLGPALSVARDPGDIRYKAPGAVQSRGTGGKEFCQFKKIQKFDKKIGSG